MRTERNLTWTRKKENGQRGHVPTAAVKAAVIAIKTGMSWCDVLRNPAGSARVTGVSFAATPDGER
jgi:hypothetical protein